MRYILIITFMLRASVIFGQKIEPDFIDNFKNYKWKSLDNFNDSTISVLKEIKLMKLNTATDTLKHYPVLWIFNNEFKIKYYYNAIIRNDGSSTETKMNFNILNCSYSYDKKKGVLTIALDDKDKTTLSYEAAIVLTGSIILLTRKN